MSMISISRSQAWRVAVFVLVTGTGLLCTVRTISRKETTFASANKEKLVRNYPDVHFVTLSDPHYYLPSLGIEGPSFERYLIADRKLLKESAIINHEMIKKVIQKRPTFVIISGDLTKDGEKINHYKFARELTAFHRAGIKVYVIPGNHDIKNGNAVQYSKNGVTPVENITPEEFVQIYEKMGYRNALARDPNSLSYLARPARGLLLLALDSCKYEENPGRGAPVTGGRIKPETLLWIQEVLTKPEYASSGVIATMHHGLLDHFPQYDTIMADYMVDNANEVADLLASLQVSLVFTGHFHASDISMKRYSSGTTIYDIETGSTITYPDTMRNLTIKNQELVIKTEKLKAIPGLKNLQISSHANVVQSIHAMTREYMRSFPISETEMKAFEDFATNAYLTHLEGDEKEPMPLLDSSSFGWTAKLLLWWKGPEVEVFYRDLPPKDRNLSISL